MAAMSSTVPISWLACWMETRIVSAVIAFFNLVKIDESFAVHIKVCHAETLLFQGLGAMQYREILYFGNDDMPALFFTESQGHSFEGNI